MSVNFDQDLQVMEKLIEKYITDGSVTNVFAKMLPIKKNPLLGGWEELAKSESAAKKGKKSTENFEDSDGDERKKGARLLLLLAYIMVSNVLDDNSLETQM